MSITVAISALPPELQTLVASQLAAWRDNAQWHQVALNVECETALPSPDFTALLSTFGQNLQASPRVNPETAWTNACRNHQFRGAVLPPARCPSVIGRALTQMQYADLLATSSAGLTVADAIELIATYGNREEGQVPPRVRRVLQASRVGRFVIWATFCPLSPTADPFATSVPNKSDVRTMLGLGHLLETETLVLLSYRPLHQGDPVALHRPTIAEAEASSFYRPHPDPVHPYGQTQPLSPNPHGLLSQPEVVHREILGEGLLLPVRVPF